MPNEVVPYRPSPMPLEEVQKIAEVAFNSLVFGNLKGPKQAVVCILAGRELGLGPMASLSAIHLIGDKPTVSANFMMALVKKSRPRYDFKPVLRSNKGARVEWYQDGDLWGESEFTEEDARSAGLLPAKPNSGWAKYTKAMYLARAVAVGFRLYAGDLAFGGNLYVTEELSDQVHPDDAGIGGDVIDTKATSIRSGLKHAIRDAVLEESTKEVNK